jgi:hypothetical protein
MKNTREHHRTINPRSTRDLRAEVMDLAATLASTTEKGVIVIEDRRISAQTIQFEWDRLLKAFAPPLRSRLTLKVLQPEPVARLRHPTIHQPYGVVLKAPNFRFEVLRQLIGADIDQTRPQSVDVLVKRTGASQFTVRKVLGDLVGRGIVKQSRPANARFSLTATGINPELLVIAQAMPEVLRFRYAAGIRPRPTEQLIQRFEQLMQPGPPAGWTNIGLSGSLATNLLRLPHVDLLGVPRMDLTAYVGKVAKMFDISLLNELDSGLEYVPDVFCPASLVITLVRSDVTFNHPDGGKPWRFAQSGDIYLALIHAGLREQALQFADGGGRGW